MARRRNIQNNNNNSDNNAVRGPSSALTSFLREQGINANEIRLRHQERLRNGGLDQQETIEEDNEENGTDELNQAKSDDEEEVYSDDENGEIQQMRETARVKRRRANEYDSDDDEEVKNYCMECDKEFNISVYSKKKEKNGSIGYLCPECTKLAIAHEKLTRKNEIEARKRRKKISAALLNKQEFKIPSLQDICIKIITDNIEAVDLLGDIGVLNMRKISRILSKNRSLNSKTMPLFLDRSLKELEFWDCSHIDRDALNQIASFCPDLEKLNLNMCGQLHNETLQYFGTKLHHLQHLTLNGPFLISDTMWQDFFDSSGKNLKGFNIRNTHRFTGDSLIALLDNCGPNLESLTLSKLDGLTNKSHYDILAHYLQNLKHLEISYPNKEELIDDDLMVNILAINGGTLETLILDGCSDLTDQLLISGIKPFYHSGTQSQLGQRID
ncbi:unnamed protein product [Ambrosiozyma monospora]|uniref:Unnamed protein product n=1 Tax=Ambrosiozyma monospora TaxID=43982 RepID=A0A9W6Z4U5_AMBMO|nr:unnamed protein product [Ambrosiozyma monospora]